MKKSYIEKLRDPRWQRLRLEILSYYEWRCDECESEDKTLHVHHEWYEDNEEPWEASPDALVALCAECHEKRTILDRYVNREFPRALRRLGVSSDGLREVIDAIPAGDGIEPSDVVELLRLFFANGWFRTKISTGLLGMEMNRNLMSAEGQRRDARRGDQPPNVGL